MKRQVIVIPGGQVFETYQDYISYLQGIKIESLEDLSRRKWKDYLAEDLGDEFDVYCLKSMTK